jgi:hypothetical protein
MSTKDNRAMFRMVNIDAYMNMEQYPNIRYYMDYEKYLRLDNEFRYLCYHHYYTVVFFFRSRIRCQYNIRFDKLLLSEKYNFEKPEYKRPGYKSNLIALLQYGSKIQLLYLVNNNDSN